jgi:hypothetical protein
MSTKKMTMKKKPAAMAPRTSGSTVARCAECPPPAPLLIQPDPTSIFILFEGPWVIDQLSQGVLRATTFYNLPMPNMCHVCQVGFGDSEGNLANPIGIGQPPLTLNGGEKWCITTPIPLLSQWKQLSDVFDVPFNRETNNDVFVYVKNPDQTRCVNPHPGEDRVVIFPTPDNVYLAGRLNTGTVNATTLSTLEYDPNGAQQPMPHVTTICEYTKQSGGNLTLTLGGAAMVPIAEGKHFIFRMLHKGPQMSDADEAAHIQAAFAALWSRVDPIASSLSLADIQDASHTRGSYTAGFGEVELGLADPPKPAHHGGMHPDDETPDNCGGGGFVLSQGS